jgi:tetratricopeptide (TPR) repeat protein
LLLGNLLVALGDEELAESYLRQAIERFPDDFWLNHDLAIHLLGGIKQNPEQAVRAMSVARALRAREKIVDFHLGLTLKLAQRNEEAVRVLKLVVAAIPHLEEARDLLARAYDDLGDLKATIESLKESLTVLPESSVLRYRLGHALKRAGKLLEAEAQFQRLLSSEAQRAEDYSCRALALYHLGLGRESLVELQEGHRHFPSHYLLAFNLAEGYRLSGREAESRELFAEAAKLEPSQPYAHRKAGLALVRNRQYREAQPYLEKAYRLEPLRIDTLAALAKCYAMAGQVAEGDRLFRELLTKLPDQSYLQLEYGHFLREANRLDESRKIFEPLCRREPFNLSAHRGLSLLLQKQTRFEEAEKLLKVLFDRAKDDRSSLDRIRPWLREAESLTRRHLDWERYRREGQLPEEAWERLALAQFVEEWFPEPEATLRLYQSAFEKHPRLLHDPKTSARIQAARAAIRLVGTQSQVEEQQRFRRLTREWLELEVRLIELKLNSLEPHEVEHSRQRIDLLLSEPAFEPVRSLQSIETLSETEYVEWQAIWDRLRRFKER